MPIILATQEAEIRRIVVQSQPWQIVQEIPSQKNPSLKRDGGVTQVVQPLPCKVRSWVQTPKPKKQQHYKHSHLKAFCGDRVSTIPLYIIAQTGLKLTILLPPTPKCYRHIITLNLTLSKFKKNPLWECTQNKEHIHKFGQKFILPFCLGHFKKWQGSSSSWLSYPTTHITI
jgi:hypothetical protein